MAVTRRSQKAAGASSAASGSQVAAHYSSLRARLPRLSLSSWVALAAFLFMVVLSLLGPQGGGMGNAASRAQSGAFSSYVFGPSATARWAAEPKPMSQPCPSTQLDPWPLGVEFKRAKSDKGIKCLEYKYTVRVYGLACAGSPSE